ncbi:MAG: LLM class flavin-dependent oxidoreductase [Acidimicrobiia bacterium]|nr:LLM class flavin-dependent oxidoreductase [Acidimicrobiia bacterium]
MVRIGAVLPADLPPHKIAHVAQTLDPAADSLWVWDDLGFNGGLAQAAIALASTRKATVALGITPVAFRHPASAAMEFSTLAEAFPNRFIAGLGHGVQHWMHQLGEAVDSPLTRLRETHQAISALLAGQTVTTQDQYITLTDVALRHPPGSPPPIYIGARGPATIRYAGRAADGMITAEWTSPTVIEQVRGQLRPNQPLVAYVAYDNPEPHRLESELNRHLTEIQARTDIARTVAPNRKPDQLNLSDIQTASAIGGPDQLHQTAATLTAAGATEIVLVAQSTKALDHLPHAIQDLRDRTESVEQPN